MRTLEAYGAIHIQSYSVVRRKHRFGVCLITWNIVQRTRQLSFFFLFARGAILAQRVGVGYQQALR